MLARIEAGMGLGEPLPAPNPPPGELCWTITSVPVLA
jgi:hypothetical protein